VWKQHHGRAIGAVLARLACDIEGGRDTSIGVEWAGECMAQLDDGSIVSHPMIQRHGLKRVTVAPAKTALLLIDADANLDINRRIFGGDLHGIAIQAVRQAHVTQVYDATLATSSLAPDERLPNNQAKAERLRTRIAAMVAREAGRGKTVVFATKPVRRALTGEADGALPVAVDWQDAEASHFGRHQGSNRWSGFATAVIVGREQLPPLAAERTARAIYANAPGVTLNLSGTYERELRHHDMRDGNMAPPVLVQVHCDPRVQAIVEMRREQAVAQAVDRLRLVHRNPANPGRVLLLTNLPIPGIVVDRLVKLDDMTDGGSPIELALARVVGGVLPLVPRWLHEKMGDLFTSKRTVEREVQRILRPPLGNKNTYCEVAVFRTAGQKFPSKALVRLGTAGPCAALAALLGVEIVAFRILELGVEAPQAEVDEPDPQPVAPMPTPNTNETQSAPVATGIAAALRRPACGTSTPAAEMLEPTVPIPASAAPVADEPNADPVIEVLARHLAARPGHIIQDMARAMRHFRAVARRLLATGDPMAEPFWASAPAPVPKPAPKAVLALSPGAADRLRALGARLEAVRPPHLWHDALDDMRIAGWRKRLAVAAVAAAA
jgi:hypothetical protein